MILISLALWLQDISLLFKICKGGRKFTGGMALGEPKVVP